MTQDDQSSISDLRIEEERRDFERIKEQAVNDLLQAREEFERTKEKFAQLLASKGIQWDPAEYTFLFFPDWRTEVNLQQNFTPESSSPLFPSA